MSDERSLMDEFLGESREHLERTENDLALLEREGEDPDGELVRRIFRAVHTIKGSSGFFGFVRIGSVAHAMESLLDRLRSGSVRPCKEVLDILFEGLDRLSGLFADIENSNQEDTKELERRILSLVPQEPKAERACACIQKSTQEQVPQEVMDDLPCGHHLYRLTYDLCAMERERKIGPMALIERLLSFGNIYEGSLESAGSRNLREGIPDAVRYNLYFSSVLEKFLVTEAVMLPDELVEEIAYATSSPDVLASLIALQGKAGSQPCAGAPTSSDLSAAPEGERHSEAEYLKVRLDILDKLMALAGELVLVRNQQLMIADPDNAEARGITQRLDIVTSDLQETIMRTRMQPIGGLFARFGRVVRDLGRKLGKEIGLESVGSDVELDKNILESLVDPLTHIVRNSCDHGIEEPQVRERAGKPRSGTVTLRAYHEGGQINVEIQDDGAGIDRGAVRRKVLEKKLKSEEELNALSDPELLGLVFLPGFSTSDQVTDVSGRGVGMDVVKSNVEELGGVVEIQSEEGKGTCMRLRLPLTLAIIPSMIIETCGQRFAIPQINLEELVKLYDEDVLHKVECAGAREVYRLRDTMLPLVQLQELLEKPDAFDEDARRESTERHRKQRQQRHADFLAAARAGTPIPWSLSFAVLKVGESRFGLVIDRIVGTEEIVVKPMHRVLKDLPIYSGATVLGDGHVALILDVQGIARHCGTQMDESERMGDSEAAEDSAERHHLLLFRNRPEEQMGLPLDKVSRIERIQMSEVESIGDREFITVQGVSTRLLRLDRFLEISVTPQREEMYALFPKSSAHPYCLLVPELVDIGEYEFSMDIENYRHPGIDGTGLIAGHLTVIVRPEAIARMAEPEWQWEEA